MKTLLLAACLLLLSAAVGRGTDSPARQMEEELFRPGGTTHAALSPDGRYVAYATAGIDALDLTIIDLNGVGTKVSVPIGRSTYRSGLPVGRPIPRSGWVPNLLFMQWVNARQLVYARSVRTDEGGRIQDVRIIDADGKNDRVLMDRNALEFRKTDAGGTTKIGRHIRLLGLDPDRPGVLMLEADGTPPLVPDARYALDLSSRKVREVSTLKEGRALFDATGRERLLETERAGTDGQQRYQLRKTGFIGGWVDLDAVLGSEAGVTFAHTDKDFFGERAIPLSFDRINPDLLYYAANVGRDTYGIYAFDLRTKQRTELAVEDARFDLVDHNGMYPGSNYLGADNPDTPLIFDRQQKLFGVRVPGVPSRTRWFEPKLARLQEQLNAKYPGRRVEIRDWDLAIRRVAALVSGIGDPGRFILCEEGEQWRMTELVERTPWLPLARLNPARPFEFVTSDGITLMGNVIGPRQTLVKNPPLVVLLPDFGWRNHGAFDRQAQLLAFCGFVVMRLDYRGISGLGREHRYAMRAGFDRVPLNDARAAIDWLAKQNVTFDRERIGLVGEGYGGYLALRAMELYPKEFRTAVAFAAPTDLALWTAEKKEKYGKIEAVPVETVIRGDFFEANPAKLREISILPNLDAVTKPVYILQPQVPFPDNPAAFQGREVVQRLRAKRVEAEYAEIGWSDEYYFTGPDGVRTTPPRVEYFQFAYAAVNPGSTAVWLYRATPEIQRTVQDFLTAQLYDFSVRVGQEKVVE